MDQLIADYIAVNAEYKSLNTTRDAIKAQILSMSQNASKIISKHGTISCAMSKGSKGKMVTEDMVGTFINARKSYRGFRVNLPKGV